MSLVLFLVTVISLPLHFCMQSLSDCIDVSTLSSMLASPLSPSLLDTYSLSMSSFGWNALCMVISFLVLWSFSWSSSLVHFKNGPEYLMRGTGTTQVFIPFFGSSFGEMKVCASVKYSILTRISSMWFFLVFWIENPSRLRLEDVEDFRRNTIV